MVERMLELENRQLCKLQRKHLAEVQNLKKTLAAAENDMAVGLKELKKKDEELKLKQDAVQVSPKS